MKLQAKQGKTLRWKEYMDVILTRFSEELYGDLILEMKNLRQEGSLVDYQRDFDALLHKVHLVENISEGVVVSQFWGGL